MKEMTIEEKAKAYDEAIEKARKLATDLPNGRNDRLYHVWDLETLFPELKKSEDERISKEIIKYLEQTVPHHHRDEVLKSKEWIAWLEKQGEKKSIWHNEDEEPQRGSLILLVMQSGTPIVAKIIEPNHTFNHGERWAYIDDLLEKQDEPAKLREEEQNKFAKGVLTSYALSFIDYLDMHKYEGKMCVSNGECEDIENAFHNAMWDKLHRYYCKYIEKQGTSYTKRDVDDAYVEGMAFAKNELEKQKPAWSEEDESWFEELELMALSFSNDVSYLKKFFDWLKSIKDKYTWKPSIAQLNALSIVSKGNASDDMEAIVSLYNDLKKLT